MAAKKPQTPKQGRDLNEFRSSFDRNYIVPEKIKAAIAQIGPEAWVYEMEFVKLAGLSQTDLGMFREQFEDYYLLADRANKKRIWCGSKEFATQLREMIG